jgi:GDP-D-mannose 3', 5'-epimerase
MVMAIVGKKLTSEHVPGPTGVRGRNSDNALIGSKLNFEPDMALHEGLTRTYPWIEAQVQSVATAKAIAACAADCC